MSTQIHPAPARFSVEQLTRDPILQFFHYAHLPAALQASSKPFCDVAEFLINTLGGSAERSVALRKLLEAKDAAVRANVSNGLAVASKNSWYDRLILEHKELADKVSRLGQFLNDGADAVSADERELLRQQHLAMCNYLTILEERVASSSVEHKTTARQGTAEIGRRKPTIAELEDILDKQGQDAVNLRPDGEAEIRETGGHDSVEDPPKFTG